MRDSADALVSRLIRVAARLGRAEAALDSIAMPHETQWANIGEPDAARVARYYFNTVASADFAIFCDHAGPMESLGQRVEAQDRVIAALRDQLATAKREREEVIAEKLEMVRAMHAIGDDAIRSTLRASHPEENFDLPPTRGDREPQRDV